MLHGIALRLNALTQARAGSKMVNFCLTDEAAKI
jgi:hypothetical protein